MAEQKVKNWGREEDARLHVLWRKKSKNGKKPLIDTTKLDKPYLEAIRAKHFPERTNYTNFSNTYRKKARAWNLAQTLAGSRNQEEEAADEEEDDDDEDYTPDEDIEDDEVEGLANDLKEPATAGDPDIDKELAEETRKKMKVASKRSSSNYSMSYTYPYIMYNYVSEERRYCSIDFLVPTQDQKNFKPAMASPNVLTLATLVPEVFIKQRRLLDAHADDKKVNVNTHKVTSFTETADNVEKQHTNPITDELQLIGKPQEITLPFPCEEEIVDWECQLHVSDENDFQDALGCDVYINVLSVDLVSIEKKKKKKKGKMRVIGSPVRADENMETASHTGSNDGSL